MELPNEASDDFTKVRTRRTPRMSRRRPYFDPCDFQLSAMLFFILKFRVEFFEWTNTDLSGGAASMTRDGKNSVA
jgi:hypothetical protein